jgi:DNA-binding CsgD family transcriptional regulator
MAADLAAARAGILAQVREPLPGALFAEGAMTAFARAVGFDGYCLFGVDPLTGLRTMMFSRHGLLVATERLVHNETVEHDVNRYAELVTMPRKAAILAPGPSEPRSPRLHEILRPEGYRSELRLVLVSGGRYWGALSLFRDDARFPFTESDADLAHELCEPLSQAIRRYHVGRPSPLPAPRPAGTVLFNRTGGIVHVSDEAHLWLLSLADSWADGTTEDDVKRIVHEVARAAAGRNNNPPLCRVRMPTGEWLVVSGTRVSTGEIDVVVVLRPGDVATVAPAFGAWCGLTPKETQVVALVAAGLAAKQMARQLSLSVLTVNDHLKSIYRKAEVRGRDELVSLLS